MKRLAISVLLIELSALAFAAAIPGGSVAQAPVPQVSRATSAQPAASAPPSSQAANDVIKTFCVGCHNDKVHRGEMSLASFDITQAPDFGVGLFLGDYQGLTTVGNDFLAAWSQPHDADKDSIFFRRVGP